MINTNKLRGIMAEQGKSQKDVAEAIGITPRTLYSHMKSGKFWTDEIDGIVKFLDIKNPAEIFLAKQ